MEQEIENRVTDIDNLTEQAYKDINHIRGAKNVSLTNFILAAILKTLLVIVHELWLIRNTGEA